MATTAEPACSGTRDRRDSEVTLVRLYLLRAVALFLAVSGCFTMLPLLIHPVGRGMIDCFLAGLWVFSFFALRYPLQMLPVFLFEFVWKTIWLLDFGLPRWLAGAITPQLRKDLLEIGLIPILALPIIPWGYVWRHYVKEPSERWR